ncbi:MAG: hypothetical protein ABI548_00995 [Polyangiaceae bacterium]
MTRQQVARRLGRSLATVRRIEGVLLHPVRDDRGVHRFNAAEVETLAQKIDGGQVALGPNLRHSPLSSGDTDGPCASCKALKEQLELMRVEQEEFATSSRRTVTALEAQLAQERSRYAAEQRAMTIELAELMATIEGL